MTVVTKKPCTFADLWNNRDNSLLEYHVFPASFLPLHSYHCRGGGTSSAGEGELKGKIPTSLRAVLEGDGDFYFLSHIMTPTEAPTEEQQKVQVAPAVLKPGDPPPEGGVRPAPDKTVRISFLEPLNRAVKDAVVGVLETSPAITSIVGSMSPGGFSSRVQRESGKDGLPVFQGLTFSDPRDVLGGNWIELGVSSVDEAQARTAIAEIMRKLPSTEV
ncbi:MAG: hypothetical protein Q8P95_03990 [bacterium]|nr:hypothetical protein [bacterium]